METMCVCLSSCWRFQYHQLPHKLAINLDLNIVSYCNSLIINHLLTSHGNNAMGPHQVVIMRDLKGKIMFWVVLMHALKHVIIPSVFLIS